MTDENNLEDFELDDFSDDEEIALKSYTPSSPTQVNPLVVETENLKRQNERLAEELDSISKAINSGKQNQWLSAIIEKYSEVDPMFRSFALELLEGHGKVTAETISKVTRHIDKVQKDIAAFNAKADAIDAKLTQVDTDVKVRTLIKSSMERFFKKASISENAIDKASELFAKKRESDQAFELKVRSITADPKLTFAQKDKLIGTMIAQNYHTYLIDRKTKGKATSDDADPKSRITKDESVDKAEKKHEKNKNEALKGEDGEVKFDREAAKARLSRLFT